MSVEAEPQLVAASDIRIQVRLRLAGGGGCPFAASPPLLPVLVVREAIACED